MAISTTSKNALLRDIKSYSNKIFHLQRAYNEAVIQNDIREARALAMQVRDAQDTWATKAAKLADWMNKNPEACHAD